MRALAAMVLAVGVALAAPGCADNAGPERDAGVAIDGVLLAYLSQARSAHLKADLLEREGSVDEAIATLARFAVAPVPGGDEPPPEAREVLADALARLAELRSARGQNDEARAVLRRGLELVPERTHYRGRLLEVLGAVEKRELERLRAGGDEEGARKARDRSLAALEEAITIQEEVIRRALDGRGE